MPMKFGELSGSTLEFLGIWERVHNPDFNYGEFAMIASQAGLNSYKKTERKTLGWDIRRNLAKLNYRIHTHAIRDQANGAQLVCLSNLENLNALFIVQDLPQPERLARLNRIAIHQMKLLTLDERPAGLVDGKGRI
jgi:hypothetical protein